MTSCIWLLSVLVLQSSAEIHAGTHTALTATATSPPVNVSAEMDGWALGVTTEMEVGGVLHMHTLLTPHTHTQFSQDLFFDLYYIQKHMPQIFMLCVIICNFLSVLKVCSVMHYTLLYTHIYTLLCVVVLAA